MSDGLADSSYGESLEILTVDEIISAGHPIVFGKQDRRSKSQLLYTVSTLAEGDQLRIYAAAVAKRASELTPRPAKRRRLTDAQATKTASSEAPTTLAEPSSPASDGVDPEFFKSQPREIVEACITRFIDRTGNAAVKTVVCVVCARGIFSTNATVFFLGSIPNRHLLVPFESHPAHQLTDGLLLQVSAIRVGSDGQSGAVCNECIRNLRKGRVPRLALANGMWIGEVPFELAALTIPEQILIARHYPAAYIVKMYPKRKGARSLNSGLRGNVSTYRLDTGEIADMVGDKVMPPPSKIFASTIGVTIVGPKNVPEKTMPGFLRVRRQRVRAALVWLKANNPFYSGIDISEERLGQLAEDDIPSEILSTMRHSDDIEELDRERAGYMPEDEDEDVGTDKDGLPVRTEYGLDAAG